MAGEPILIVDDTPVTLNLMRLVLTHEGYAVRTAGRAEEAIDLLGSFRPDLILADIRLPGMDGLEMTRRIKKNPQTNTIKVVALTGSANEDDPDRAAQAGCDEYLTRPIEAQVLASRIREVLDRPDTTAISGNHLLPPAEPEPSPLSGPEVEGLRSEFLNEGAAGTRQMLESLPAAFDADAAARRLHSWIGGAGLLDYPEIAKMARSLEEMLRHPTFDPDVVRERLYELVRAFEELEDGAAQPVPADKVEALRGRRMALIGFTPECADSLFEAMAGLDARPLLFDAAEDPCSPPIQECDLVIVHVRPETLSSRWLDGAAPLPAGMRLVLAGDRQDLLSLPVTVLAGDAELLADPGHADEVLMRLFLALKHQAPVAVPVPVPALARVPQPELAPPAPTVSQAQTAVLRPRVVMADDDAIVLTVVSSTLRNYGMACEPANNGRDALRLIRETKPHIAVLDVNMPGLDGYEVLAAVREEGLPVSVILLTARQREGDILRGFQLGADDYLVKPFNPLELMARTKRLLRR